MQQCVWQILRKVTLWALDQTKPKLNSKNVPNVSTWKRVCPGVTLHFSVARGNSGLSWPHQVSWLSFYRPLGAVVNFKKCRCAYWTVLRPNGSPDPTSSGDSLDKGLSACRSPGETLRLIFAAEGCNIEASQLNPLPNICHFPLTGKIKKPRDRAKFHPGVLRLTLLNYV